LSRQKFSFRRYYAVHPYRTIIFAANNIGSRSKSIRYTNDQTSPNTITGFLAKSDGSLTQVPGSPFTTGDNGQNGAPFSLAVTTLKERNYLYAANGADGTISGFRINPTTGNLQLVPSSPFATNGQPANYSLAVSPNNQFLFVASDETALIHVFRISRGTGRYARFQAGHSK